VEKLEPRINGWVESAVTYLEMQSPPDRPKTAPLDGVEMRRAIKPTISFYRYLYNSVGGDWTWTGRRLMDDATLAKSIQDPDVEVNVLWVQGVPAGLIELDLRSSPEIELLYFGLIPDFIGRGLGRYALDWAIDHAWSHRPTRFWVHTCDLDHPNALSVYQKAGFVIYDQGTDRDAFLEGLPWPRRNGINVQPDEISPA